MSKREVKYAKLPNNWVIQITDEKGNVTHAYANTEFNARSRAEQEAGHPVEKVDAKEILAPYEPTIDVKAKDVTKPAKEKKEKRSKKS
jgi:hypothetical protein